MGGDEEDFTAGRPGNKDASMRDGADGVDLGEGYYEWLKWVTETRFC